MTCISNGFWYEFFLETLRQGAKELAVLQLCSAAAVWKSAPGFYSGLKFSSFSDFFPSILVGITENSFGPIWNRFPPPPFYFSWPAVEPTNQLLCSSLYYVPYKSIVPTRLFSITPPSFNGHGQMVVESKYFFVDISAKKAEFYLCNHRRWEGKPNQKFLLNSAPNILYFYRWIYPSFLVLWRLSTHQYHSSLLLTCTCLSWQCSVQTY